MTTTWRLEGIISRDASTMRIRITEVLDGVDVRAFDKDFAKTLDAEQVLDQLALFVKQKRQQALDNRLPFKALDLSDFETRIGNA